MTERFELTWGVAFHGLRRRYLENNRRERGEGVISAAIAVLIMAFLGYDIASVPSRPRQSRRGKATSLREETSSKR